MVTYKQLKDEFDKRVTELRKDCKHPKISDWMRFEWAIGHDTGIQVKVCKICEKIINERTKCCGCGQWVEKTNWIEGDGEVIPFGVTICSKECVELCRRKYPVFPSVTLSR